MVAPVIWYGAAGAVGAGLLSWFFGRSDVPPPPVPPLPVGTGWKGGNPEALRELAMPLEYELGWWGLGDFLAAAAWTESHGNPKAGSSGMNNKARGLLGGRPNSMFRGKYKHFAQSNPNLLKDPRWAIATTAAYLDSLRDYAFPGQTIDWLALRRGMAFPRLVSDVNEEAKVKGYPPGRRSADTRNRFQTGIEKAGLQDEFMYEAAFPPGYQWLGLGRALQLLGAPNA